MKTETPEKTFAQLAADPVGTVYHLEHKDGYCFVILRGPGALCAYIGIPESHPLAAIKDYDSLPIECHGGLTYAGEKPAKAAPDGFQWFGWDYAHSGDKSFYDLDSRFGLLRGTDSKEWLVSSVKADSWSAGYSMEKLMRLAEKIKSA